MNEYNDDKIRKMMESQEVPDSISPENIKLMLEEKAPKKKREKITHKAVRITAGAAACAVICGVGAHVSEQGNLFNKNTPYTETEESKTYTAESFEEKAESSSASQQVSVMASPQSYNVLYSLFEDAYEDYSEDFKYSSNNIFAGGMATDDGFIMEDAMEQESVDMAIPEATMAAGSTTTATGTQNGLREEGKEYTETYNQEEGVLEADAVKTDGEYIYYLNTWYGGVNSDSALRINIAKADNGKFTSHTAFDVTNDFISEDGQSFSLSEMYLYNDMLIVVGEIWSYGFYDGYYCGTYANESQTCVNVYTTGLEPELIGTYIQDGSYNDVRIAPDGFMYLVTEDRSESFTAVESSEDIEAYVPSYTVDGDCCVLEPECILIPEEIEKSDVLAYTVIGTLDFNTAGAFAEGEVKAIAGASGAVYCSGSNLYTASGWENTEITRIALENGKVTAAASGSVDGYIKDQFSMSEYNGYFRIVTTSDEWQSSFWDGIFTDGETREINNHLYVLDMELNVVGHATDFGIGETVKSSTFSGNMAYVVTYEQTDPLYSFDLSNPESPVILDEFKILGYSTYMQQWSDGLLLGFGIDADEYGVEQGIKLVMFDNSDPNNLEEVGLYAMSQDEGYLYSTAVWERKALLIAPEKNLIGVPVDNEYYGRDDMWHDRSEYVFFSYENGEFIRKGALTNGDSTEYGRANFDRAVYIGEYVYALSAENFVAADIATITETDRVSF